MIENDSELIVYDEIHDVIFFDVTKENYGTITKSLGFGFFSVLCYSETNDRDIVEVTMNKDDNDNNNNNNNNNNIENYNNTEYNYNNRKRKLDLGDIDGNEGNLKKPNLNETSQPPI